MGFVFIISSLVILYSDDYVFGDLNIIRFILLVFWRFGYWLRHHLQGVAGGLVESKLMTTSNNLKMGTESVPEASANLHTLTRVSAQENLI